jgi:hypothetical protein
VRRPDPIARLPRPALITIDGAHGWHRKARTATRVYRFTPPALRRPEPALRAATAGATLWFAVLFVALGIASLHHGAGPGDGAPGLLVHSTTAGYLLAACVGGGGLGLVATRRLRPAAWCLGGMLVLGQVVSVASAL